MRSCRREWAAKRWILFCVGFLRQDPWVVRDGEDHLEGEEVPHCIESSITKVILRLREQAQQHFEDDEVLHCRQKGGTGSLRLCVQELGHEFEEVHRFDTCRAL